MNLVCHCSGPCAVSEAVRCWFMAFLLQSDDIFTHALLWIEVWFKKMCYSGAQSTPSPQRGHFQLWNGVSPWCQEHLLCAMDLFCSEGSPTKPSKILTGQMFSGRILNRYVYSIYVVLNDLHIQFKFIFFYFEHHPLRGTCVSLFICLLACNNNHH